MTYTHPSWKTNSWDIQKSRYIVQWDSSPSKLSFLEGPVGSSGGMYLNSAGSLSNFWTIQTILNISKHQQHIVIRSPKCTSFRWRWRHLVQVMFFLMARHKTHKTFKPKWPVSLCQPTCRFFNMNVPHLKTTQQKRLDKTIILNFDRWHVKLEHKGSFWSHFTPWLEATSNNIFQRLQVWEIDETNIRLQHMSFCKRSAVHHWETMR